MKHKYWDHKYVYESVRLCLSSHTPYVEYGLSHISDCCFYFFNLLTGLQFAYF